MATLTKTKPTDISFEIISDEESRDILQKTEVHGDPFAGKVLTPEILEKNDLLPKYKIKVGEATVWFSSSPYVADDDGRIGVVAYVEKDNKIVARTYYRSNSQGVWRYLPEYIGAEGAIDWYGKGYGEEGITLPISLQKALSEISQTSAPLDIQDRDLVFAGTAREISATPKPVTYKIEVESLPQTLEGNFYPQKGQKIPPEQITFTNPDDEPDFQKTLLSWQQNTDLYGDVTVEVIPSKNGQYNFMFVRDKEGRVWIGGIESEASEIGSTGLRKQWVSGGDLTTPGFEYGSQAGGFGGPPHPQYTTYVDVYQKYLSKIPIIQEYVKQRGIAQPSPKPEVPPTPPKQPSPPSPPIPPSPPKPPKPPTPPPSPPPGPPPPGPPPPGPPPGPPPSPPPGPTPPTPPTTPPIPEAEGYVPYGTTRWPYYVAPPFWGAWAITDPAGAFAALPYGAVGIPAYIGYKKLKQKIQDLKENLAPLRWITAPGQQLKEQITRTSGRILRRGLGAATETLGGGWLFKAQKVMGPDGRLYRSLEFMPAVWTREKVGKFFEKLGGGRDKSRFTKAAKNLLDYKIGYDSHRRPQARRKLRGIGILFGLFGALIVGVIIDEIWDRFKRRFLRGARATRALTALRGRSAGLSRSWRVGKGAASWNTAAGAALGYAIGGPVGAVIGGSGGAFYSMVKNAAEEPHWKYRYRLAELEKTGELKKITLPPQMKPFGKWQARLYRPSAILARRELLRYAPLQGVALGYILGGPPGAVTFGSAQLLWMSRGWAKKQLANLADALTVRLSPKEISATGFSRAKYPRFDTFLRKGPGWARGGGWGLEQLRLPRRYAAGTGIGALFGYVGTGGNPLGAVAGAAIGGGTQIGASAGIRFTTRQVRTFYSRHPTLRYSKGAGIGALLGFGLVPFGVPWPVAMGIGAVAGVGTQFAVRTIGTKLATRGATKGAEIMATAATKGASRFMLRLPFKLIPFIGTAYLVLDIGIRTPFSLGADLIKKHAIDVIESDYKAGKIDRTTYLIQIGAAKTAYWILKGPAWLADKILYPFDKAAEKFAEWLFNTGTPWFFNTALPTLYSWGASAGSFLGKVFGWTTKLPGPVGGLFGKIGDFLGGVGDKIGDFFKAVGSFAQGVASAILAFFSAVGTLVFGGDVVEAAIAIAIALVFTGALFNTGIAGAFPDELVGLIGNLTGLVKLLPGPGESPDVEVEKTVEIEGNLFRNLTTVSIENEDLPRKATFTITITPKGIPLENLVCHDVATLFKEDETTEELFQKTHDDLGCPEKLGATETWTKTFTFDIPNNNEERFKNAIITNAFALAGNIEPVGEDNVPPNQDNCGGRYSLKNPLGNFGDPLCDFSLDRLSQVILATDPANLNTWLCIQSFESPGQGPNAYNPNTPDPGGAWGLFQMASQRFGSPNDLNEDGIIYDIGDVEWHLQTSNAINYNNIELKPLGLDFRYWQPYVDGRCR